MKCALRINQDQPFLIIGYEKRLYVTDGSNNLSNTFKPLHVLNLENISITSLSSIMNDSIILCASS
jgi:hypothetical protein